MATAGQIEKFTSTNDERPTWELYSTCIHCGLCLNACPTYRVLGTEMDSPRGRIYQIAQVEEGRMAVGETLVEHIDRCLDCRACETACPSGVQYGRIVERARALIEREYERPWLERRIRRYFFRTVLSRYGVLSRWAQRVRFYQKSGLRKLARASGILHLLGMHSLEALAPEIDQHFYLDEIGMMFPAHGERRGRVAFLAGCIASVSFSELNRATVRVMQENGFDVTVTQGQGCCGALQAHAGFREEAKVQARRNIKAMLSEECDAIITNAAGCGSTMKEYGDLLSAEPNFAGQVQVFTAKVRDACEFLAEKGLRPVRHPLRAKVTYQDPCHLAHGQKIRSAPREILRYIGADLVEMPHSDHCCGSAGTYNVTQHALSMEILKAKMDDVLSVQADVLATANVGCMLQLRAGVEQRGAKIEVHHVLELLDGAY